MKASLDASLESVRKSFFSLTSRQDVAGILEIPDKVLIYNLFIKSDASKYKQIEINKRNGKKRLIMIPNTSLKILQRKIAFILSSVYSVKTGVHGYTSGRSTITNASVHVRAKLLLNIDIKDFFPSINFGRVRGMFLGKPYLLGKQAATTIAQICCFNNQLPQGSPASPIISNMICAQMDSELFRLCQKYRLLYSRYADDISISSKHIRKDQFVAKLNLPAQITEIIEKNGFAVNLEKTHAETSTSHEAVTGITINEKLNVSRKYVRNTRAMLHSIDRYGASVAQSFLISHYNFHNYDDARGLIYRVVLGRINYIRSVKGYSDIVFRKLFNKYIELSGIKKSKLSLQLYELVNKSTMIIEGTINATQGTAFFLAEHGWITCFHVVKDEICCKGFFSNNIDNKFNLIPLLGDEVVDFMLLETKNIIVDEPLKIGDDSLLKLGDSLSVYGFPNHSFGDELYSNQGKIVNLKTIHNFKMIFVDCPLLYGNSGGPVLNRNGEIIGVVARGQESLEMSAIKSNNGIIPISVIIRSIQTARRSKQMNC